MSKVLYKLNNLVTSYLKFLIFEFKSVQENKPEEILHSTTDATEWKLEVERVLPQLKVMIKNDNKVNFIICIKQFIT